MPCTTGSRMPTPGRPTVCNRVATPQATSAVFTSEAVSASDSPMPCATSSGMTTAPA